MPTWIWWSEFARRVAISREDSGANAESVLVGHLAARTVTVLFTPAPSPGVLWQLPGVRETRTYAVMEEVKNCAKYRSGRRSFPARRMLATAVAAHTGTEGLDLDPKSNTLAL